MTILVEVQEDNTVDKAEVYPLFFRNSGMSGEWTSFRELNKHSESYFGSYSEPDKDVSEGCHLEYLIPKEFLFNNEEVLEE